MGGGKIKLRLGSIVYKIGIHKTMIRKKNLARYFLFTSSVVVGGGVVLFVCFLEKGTE